MNAVAEVQAAVSVALLGPADAAREQLKQALIALGAELVFEGELQDGTRLASRPPQVLIVNLEPGVEDELDALQPLLDSPATSVVFNEGEVSSQLTGWDLARWARHLASKVLGVRDTLPPPPSGAERLPELSVLPEPGRPVSPSQQQDHLKFDDYAEEALGHSSEVPSSTRLELEPAPEAALDALDFDFRPVERVEPAESSTREAPAKESDNLETMDLSSLFERDLAEVSPEDMLRELQQAMGLAPTGSASAGEGQNAHAVREQSPTEVSVEPKALDAAQVSFAANAPTGDQPAAERPISDVTDSFADDFAAIEIPESVELAEASFEQGGMNEFARSDVDPVNAGEETVSANLEVQESGFSFDPVAFEAELSPVESLAVDEIEEAPAESVEAVDDALDGFDFSAFDTVNVGTRSDGESRSDFRDIQYSAEDAALGGTLTLDAGSDDEEIARLAAALDEAPSLPSAAELPGLDFDLRAVDRVDEPAASPVASIPSASEAPARPKAAASSGFGELSLQPLDEGFIDETIKAAPVAEAPTRKFDFSHLSLEPIDEGATEESVPQQAPVVPTTRDGVWLRDVEAASTAIESPPQSSLADGPSHTDADRLDAPVDTMTLRSEAAPAPLAAAQTRSLPSAAVAPLTQGVSRVIVLCASIGGPDAVRSFLAGIPAGFPALFVVVQHLENGYFERLAQQLQKTSALPVRVPMAGLGARDGEVLVVASGARFLLAQDGQVDLVEAPHESRYRPCIDDVLHDIAERFGPHASAIIFSGMAADAVEGSVYLSAKGGEIWAQDPESCVVSSMVDGARSRGVVDFVGSPAELAARCVLRYS